MAQGAAEGCGQDPPGKGQMDAETATTFLERILHTAEVQQEIHAVTPSDRYSSGVPRHSFHYGRGNRTRDTIESLANARDAIAEVVHEDLANRRRDGD